jgi:hypothetical protein
LKAVEEVGVVEVVAVVVEAVAVVAQDKKAQPTLDTA